LQTFLNVKKEARFARQTVDIMRCIFAGAFKYAVYPLGLRLLIASFQLIML